MTSILALVLGALVVAQPAEARPSARHGHGSHASSRHVTHGSRYSSPYRYRSGVTVVVNPWSAAWAPVARPGWAWVGGSYDRYGYWRPGYWRPVAQRYGYAWAGGYWVGSSWVEGYWRPTSRHGYAWVEGGYNRYGTWQEGYWQGRHDTFYDDSARLRDELRDSERENADLRDELEDERREEEREDAREREERRENGQAERRDDSREAPARSSGERQGSGGSRHHDPA